MSQRNEPSYATDTRILKAVSHPVRQRILHSLNDGVESPSNLAKAMELPLPNVSYHVKILKECDAIELVRTAPVRGALEHFYRAKVKAGPQIDPERWAVLPEAVRASPLGQSISTIAEHVSEAAADGGLDHPKNHVSWTTLELDQQAMEELNEHLEKTLERAMDLQREAANRRKGASDEEPVEHRTEAVLMQFRRAPLG